MTGWPMLPADRFRSQPDGSAELAASFRTSARWGLVSMSQFVTVAKVGEIPEESGRTFEVDDRLIAVFHSQGAYHAIDDLCPHAGASLGAGHVENCVVICPLHAWRFDVRDGTWCDNRRMQVDAFEVRVVGDEIQVSTEPKPRVQVSDPPRSSR